MGVEGKVNIVIKAQDKTGGAFGDAMGNMKKLGTAAAVAGAAIVAAGAAAMIGVAVKGVMAFSSFEDSMNEVFTLLPGISGAAMKQMRDQVLDVSVEMGRLPEEIIPALYQSLSAGVPPDNVFEFMDTAHQAALGGVTDLETAVDGISSVVNAYGSDVMSATQASDLMFTAVRLGKTDFTQLSASLSNVTPIASGMGIKFDDVAASLAAMTAQGTPTAVATTQLRALFTELGDSGSEVSQTFEKLSGESFLDFIAQGGNVGEVMTMLNDEAISTGVPIQDMFTSMRSGVAALQLSGKGLETFTDNLDAMGESAGATEAAYETMNSGMARQFEVIKATIDTTFIRIGEALAPVVGMLLEKLGPALEKVTEFITLFANAFGGAIEGIMNGEDPIEAIAMVIETLGEKLGLSDEKISELMGTWYAISDAFTTAKDKIIEIKDVIVEFMTPIVNWITSVVEVKDVLIALGIVIGGVLLAAIYSIITAILPVILIFAAIIAAVALVRHAWENNWLGIQEKTEVVLNFIRGLIETVMTWIKEFWAENGEEIVAKATAIWNTIKTIFVTSFEFYWSLIVAVMTAIKEFWAENGEEIMAKAKEIWDTIKNAIETVINTISDIITTVVTAIKEFWAENGDTILAKAEEIWNAISAVIEVVIEYVSTIISAWQSAFEGDWTSFGEKIRDAWDLIWENIKKIITEIIPKIITAISEFILDIIAKFNDVDWLQIGSDIIHGIAEGITAGVSFIVNAAKNAASAAYEAAKGFLFSDSPSKLFMELGAGVSEGFAMGISDATARVEMAMGGLVRTTIPASQDFARFGQNSGTNVVNNYNYNMQASYSKHQDEGSILNDIRIFEKLRE